MKIIIIQKKLSKNHNDSFWYDGDIAEFKKKNGTELLLIAVGDIKIYNKKGELVYDVKERNSGIKGGLNNDKNLKKIGNNYDDNYYWENNNWFEVLHKKKNMKGYESVMGDVAYDYDGAIQLLKDYIEDKTF
jgi:hypothetical protein